MRVPIHNELLVYDERPATCPNHACELLVSMRTGGSGICIGRLPEPVTHTDLLGRPHWNDKRLCTSRAVADEPHRALNVNDSDMVVFMHMFGEVVGNRNDLDIERLLGSDHFHHCPTCLGLSVENVEWGPDEGP